MNELELLVKEELLKPIQDALSDKIEIDGHELNWLSGKINDLQLIIDEGVKLNCGEIEEVLKLAHKIKLIRVQSVWQNKRFQNNVNLFILDDFRKDLEAIKKHFAECDQL